MENPENVTENGTSRVENGFHQLNVKGNAFEILSLFNYPY